MIQHLPPETPAHEIDGLLPTLTDGTYEVVAVEVFDAEESYTGVDGLEYGPWVLGPRDVVYHYLADRGYEDFEEQYSVCRQYEEEA